MTKSYALRDKWIAGAAALAFFSAILCLVVVGLQRRPNQPVILVAPSATPASAAVTLRLAEKPLATPTISIPSTATSVPIIVVVSDTTTPAATVAAPAPAIQVVALQKSLLQQPDYVDLTQMRCEQ